ncbi:MAG: MBL fold metallo-hydrolase [Patescibacteria group bacterium]|nr:MBL fold metallo-hydrolase [Patescibacteria group bacterium]MDD5490859.1 MBL fold metallo-hydrolase [Patescibacteria group bacterium]
MHISWLGQGCFKIQSGETVLVIDPYNKDIGLKPPRAKADIVVMSDPDSNGLESISGEYFLINGPGEYEIKGIFVYGIALDAVEGQKEARRTTIYRIESEGITIAHLDSLNKSLNDKELERLENIDVLIVPVGGGKVLDAKKAVEIINQIEPSVVIPMQYKIPQLKLNLDSVEKFLKEMNALKVQPLGKYTLKKKDLPPDRTEVVVLEQS